MLNLCKCTLNIFSFNIFNFINNFWFTLSFLYTDRTSCLHINRTFCLYAAKTLSLYAERILCLYADRTLCLFAARTLCLYTDRTSCLHASRTLCLYADRTFHLLAFQTLFQSPSVQHCSLTDFFQFFFPGMAIYLKRQKNKLINVLRNPAFNHINACYE